jgi:hypothetical protein
MVLLSLCVIPTHKSSSHHARQEDARVYLVHVLLECFDITIAHHPLLIYSFLFNVGFHIAAHPTLDCGYPGLNSVSLHILRVLGIYQYLQLPMPLLNNLLR